jgi:hypothetical protein
MNEFTAKFKKDFWLVSCLSTSTIPSNVWYVDSGASRHITSTQQLFSSLKKDSRVLVELGDDAMHHPVARVGTIPFQLESSNSLDFDDVLFVPGRTRSHKELACFGYGG